MGLFGFLRNTPEQTRLQDFCSKITPEIVVNEFQIQTGEAGLRNALAFLYLQTGYEFWQDLVEAKELKDYCAKTNADVIIFETIVYIWSVISTAIDEWAQEEEFLDDDDPLLEAVTMSLHGALGVVEKQWPGFDLQTYLKRRLYPRGRLESTEKFIRLLIAASGRHEPAQTEQTPLGLMPQLPIQVQTMAFAKHMLPAIVDMALSAAKAGVEDR